METSEATICAEGGQGRAENPGPPWLCPVTSAFFLFFCFSVLAVCSGFLSLLSDD